MKTVSSSLSPQGYEMAESGHLNQPLVSLPQQTTGKHSVRGGKCCVLLKEINNDRQALLIDLIHLVTTYKGFFYFRLYKNFWKPEEIKQFITRKH